MAIVKAVSSRASIANAINYITKKEKTEQKLISGIECDPEKAIEQMKLTKKAWRKTEGRQYMHFVQSFAQGEKITPQQAHEIAKDLFKDRFNGYEMIIATHKDKDHMHTHIIVNSVSYENGYKLQHSKEDYKQMKLDSDELCRKHGLSITEKGKTFEGKERKELTSYNKDKYQLLKKAEEGKVKSYVQETAVAAYMSKFAATDKEDFIARMKEKGYETDWKDNHKYITFTDPDGNKVRNSNIEKTYGLELSKESLEQQFEENRNAESVKKEPTEKQKNEVETRELKQEIKAKKEEPAQQKTEKIKPEEKLRKLYRLKSSYFSLERQIKNVIELRSNITTERSRLESSAKEVAQLSNNITQISGKISELEGQKQGLGIFKGKEKKQLEGQIKNLEMRRQQTQKELYLKYNIAPNQASEKVGELLRKCNEISCKMPPDGKVEQLRANQEMVEIQFKTEKLLLENSEDKPYIEAELKKLDKLSDGGLRNLINAAKAESKLRKITPTDLKKIVQHNPNNVQVIQAVQVRQQEISLPKEINKGPLLRR